MEINLCVPLFHHELVKLPGGSGYNRRYCVGCYKRKKRGEIDKNKIRKVTTYCAHCPRNPRYCPQCFHETHKIRNSVNWVIVKICNCWLYLFKVVNKISIKKTYFLLPVVLRKKKNRYLFLYHILTIYLRYVSIFLRKLLLKSVFFNRSHRVQNGRKKN